LTVDEALIFWRSAFSTASDDKFRKEYQYNIRHSYGLEGGRRNYTPHRCQTTFARDVNPCSCQQILMGPQPGIGDMHGCPFRHFSVDNLIASIEDDLNIRDPRVLREIKDAVQGKHYHVACTKVFEATHPANGSLVESINHPNVYFDMSFKLGDAQENQA
jgi:DNA primase large subunit